MKIFPWLLTLAFGVLCVGAWVLSSAIMLSIADQPVPGITSATLRPNGWLWLCPVPWGVYSVVLTFRKTVTMEQLLLFCGTLLLATSALISLVAVACVLPWLPIKASLGQ